MFLFKRICGLSKTGVSIVSFRASWGSRTATNGTISLILIEIFIFQYSSVTQCQVKCIKKDFKDICQRWINPFDECDSGSCNTWFQSPLKTKSFHKATFSVYSESYCNASWLRQKPLAFDQLQVSVYSPHSFVTLLKDLFLSFISSPDTHWTIFKPILCFPRTNLLYGIEFATTTLFHYWLSQELVNHLGQTNSMPVGGKCGVRQIKKNYWRCVPSLLCLFKVSHDQRCFVVFSTALESNHSVNYDKVCDNLTNLMYYVGKIFRLLSQNS